MKKIATCIIMVALFTFSIESSELRRDLDFITASNPIVELPQKETTAAARETSELKLFGIGLIKSYQYLISSQQNSYTICTFTPSCSSFAQTAIEKCGIFEGILMTADRLLRCHSFNRKYYDTHPETKKSYDPVGSYLSEK